MSAAFGRANCVSAKVQLRFTPAVKTDGLILMTLPRLSAVYMTYIADCIRQRVLAAVSSGLPVVLPLVRRLNGHSRFTVGIPPAFCTPAVFVHHLSVFRWFTV